MLRSAVSALAFLPVFWSGPAAAGEARCLWDALAPATQDRLLAAYAGSGTAGVARIRLEPAEARRQIARCVVLGGVVDPKRAVKATEVALRGFVARSASAGSLAAAGYTEQQLELAWRQLGPQKRAILHARAERTGEGAEAAADWGAEGGPVLLDWLAAVDRVSALPRTDAAVARELEAYAAGLSLQEAFEPRF